MSFIGVTVQLTLKQPPNTVLQGRVVDIVAGQNITLENALVPSTGYRLGRHQVLSQNVADISVVEGMQNAQPPPQQPGPPASSMPPVQAPPMPQYQRAPQYPPQAQPQSQPPLPPPQAPPAAPSPLPVRTTNAQSQRQTSDFVDPAILSYGRSPAQTRTASKPPQEQPSTPIKSMLAKAAESLPNNSSPFIGEAGKSSGSQKVPKMKDLSTAQTPAKSREASVSQAQNGDADGQQDYSSKKKVRRGQKKKAQDPPAVMNSEVSRNGNDMNGSVKRGKGWRQTPLLQPSPQANSPAGSGDKKMTRKQRDEAKEAQRNGWATEDATDVQDQDDFDFEANLRLFDKKTVFDQLRKDDTTADEERLVGHNKVQRNLRPNENVLSPSIGPKGSPQELDSTSDADTELNFANGRSSSRHSATRASMKRPSRQNSGQVPDRPHPLTASMSSDRGISMSRSVNSQGGKASAKKVPPITTASPRPDRGRSPHSAISTTKTHALSTLASKTTTEPHLALYPTLTPCPVLLPPGLELLEKATTARYGITPEAITESAARCTAETAMHMFDSTTLSGSRRGSRANTLTASTSMSSSMNLDRNSTPVIVIIAGNHATGARALAAARQLVCRNVKVIVAEAAYESAEMLDPQVKAQVAVLKRMVKGGANVRRGPWRRASEYIKKLAGPPAVIIDALLAGTTYESLLDTPNTTHAQAAQLETREMIDWANRSRAPVLSVGCPSGVSGTNGQVTYVEGEPLSIRPERVLALGVPMQGLLDAMKGGERWDVRLGDIGLNVALSVEDAVAFGSEWVVGLGIAEGDEAAVA